MNAGEAKSDVSTSEVAAQDEKKSLGASPTIPVLSRLEHDPDAEITYPDGGLYAWLAVLGGWIVNFCTFGYSTSFGVCQDYYTVFGASTVSNISWIGSIQMFLLFAMSFPAGRLFDMGYFYHVNIFGSFLFVFCLFMLSIADPSKYYQLLLSQGIGMGIGGGLILTPALSIQSQYFKKRRALALGIVQSGSSAGGIVYPIMLNKLFYTKAGFAWGMRASAFLTLGLLLISCCVMRTRLPTGKDGVKGATPSVKEVFSHVPYSIAVVSLLLVIIGIFFPYFYLQTWARYYDMSDGLAFYMIAILNAGSFFGRIIPNFLADYVGMFNVLCPVAYACSVLIFAMFGTTRAAPIIVFSFLYGFFSGSFFALMPPLMAYMARSQAEVGNRIGFAYSTFGLAVLIGTPIDGAVLGPGDSYHWYKALLFSGIIMVAGCTLLLSSRYLLGREKGTQIL